MVEFNALLLKGDAQGDNRKNQQWWENNPMVYDWENRLGPTEATPEYFEKIDNEMAEAHKLCNNPRWPQGDVLENFIPYGLFKDKDVLEIGCGAGLVSSHIARSGARLKAIDLTERGVLLTRRRLELKGLTGDIRQMDAEKLEFPDNSFDYVVSWGVIHHTGNMQAAMDQVYRALKPGGKAYLMVYNRDSLRYRVYCFFWRGICRLQFLKKNLDEIAGSLTDGYIARHLTKKEMREMASKFSGAEFSCSDEPAVFSYLFGPFYRLQKLAPRLGEKIQRFLAVRWGWYLQAVLTK